MKSAEVDRRSAPKVRHAYQQVVFMEYDPPTNSWVACSRQIYERNWQRTTILHFDMAAKRFIPLITIQEAVGMQDSGTTLSEEDKLRQKRAVYDETRILIQTIKGWIDAGKDSVERQLNQYGIESMEYITWRHAINDAQETYNGILKRAKILFKNISESENAEYFNRLHDDYIRFRTIEHRVKLIYELMKSEDIDFKGRIAQLENENACLKEKIKELEASLKRALDELTELSSNQEPLKIDTKPDLLLAPKEKAVFRKIIAYSGDIVRRAEIIELCKKDCTDPIVDSAVSKMVDSGWLEKLPKANYKILRRQ